MLTSFKIILNTRWETAEIWILTYLQDQLTTAASSKKNTGVHKELELFNGTAFQLVG